jgi:hypothetical protein
MMTNQVLAHRDCALLAPQRLTILEIAEPGIRIHCDGGYKASGQAFEGSHKTNFSRSLSRATPSIADNYPSGEMALESNRPGIPCIYNSLHKYFLIANTCLVLKL